MGELWKVTMSAALYTAVWVVVVHVALGTRRSVCKY